MPEHPYGLPAAARGARSPFTIGLVAALGVAVAAGLIQALRGSRRDYRSSRIGIPVASPE